MVDHICKTCQHLNLKRAPSSLHGFPSLPKIECSWTMVLPGSCEIFSAVHLDVYLLEFDPDKVLVMRNRFNHYLALSLVYGFLGCLVVISIDITLQSTHVSVHSPEVFTNSDMRGVAIIVSVIGISSYATVYPSFASFDLLRLHNIASGRVRSQSYRGLGERE